MKRYQKILAAVLLGIAGTAYGMYVNGELISAKLEKLTSDPTGTGEGRIYANTTAHTLKYHNGTSFLTAATTSNKLSVFAATTTAELFGIISDETGSGALVGGTAPTISSPVLTGVPILGNGLDIRFPDDDGSNYFNFGAPSILTGNRDINVPDASGTMVLDSATQTLSNKTEASPTVTSFALFSNQAESRYRETTANGDTFYVGFKAPADLSANKIWLLPTADGTTGQVLKTDGSGALGWVSASTTVTTTRGDLIYRAASADDRLAIGVKGQVLRSGTNDPEWKYGNDVKAVSSANYTVLDNDGFELIVVTTGASQRTITLPTAADNLNRRLAIKKVDTGAGSVLVDGEGAETIDAAANQVLYYINGWMFMVCDGTTWHLLGLQESGTYSAVFAGLANIEAVNTPLTAQFLRNKNVVSVSGSEDINPTATILTSISITLPIPSNLTDERQLSGTGVGDSTAAYPADRIFGRAANDDAQLSYIANDLANKTHSFHFTYLIL